ncbi:E3 ubiquitin-protein ligase complex slx8-rfp subunit slx8-like [Chrysoperla carnea]|uniref:E3 ubiquitin-protein ligase complex slx8-rfp subunit slx8-like n=1 Tax=Chrysoperla carnea TaxID=189513 RepID=UPI001D05FA0D|nr:E3 ubiquitin-protein ligase complex slx8-rfp subunit slx8-like [Chrysoperla carnea]
MERARKCRKVHSSFKKRSNNEGLETPRLRPRKTSFTTRSSAIYLSSDSDGEEVGARGRIANPWNVDFDVAVNEDFNALDRNLNFEMDNMFRSSNFIDYDVEDSDVNQFNPSVLSDLIDNDVPIEYHDQTLDITDEDDVEYVGSCSVEYVGSRSGTSQKAKPTTSSSTSDGVEKKNECPVCLEYFSQSRPMYSTFCGHVYCKDCIFQVLKTSKKCPNCRKSLNKNKVHPIYLY